MECTVRKRQISRIFQNERNRDLITAVSEQEGSGDLWLQMADRIPRCQIRSRWQQKEQHQEKQKDRFLIKGCQQDHDQI